MNHNRLPLSEGSIFASREYLFKKFRFPFDEGHNFMYGMSCRRSDGNSGYYYTEEIRKTKIVLHFTAGHLSGDLRSLTDPSRHVSVSYLISRGGLIIQLFNPKFWSYHLGRGSLGGNTAQSSQSIGIELSNYGYLVENGRYLETYHSTPEQRDIYASKMEGEYYNKLNTEFRGRKYFASYTQAQYSSLIVLLKYLTEKFNIPRRFLDEDIRYTTTQEVVGFSGIVSHINFRHSGKWDIGPAFSWGKIINALNSDDVEEMSIPAFIAAEDFDISVTDNEDQLDEIFPVQVNTSKNTEDMYGPDGPED